MYQNTPLNWAEEYQYSEIAQLLIDKGAKSNPHAVSNEKMEASTELMQKGSDEHSKGNYDKARGFYLQALEINPYKSYAYANLALVNMFEHDYEACLENTYKAIELDGKNAHALYSTAQCLFMLHKPKKDYLAYYKRYIELEPNNFRTKELLQKYPELKAIK